MSIGKKSRGYSSENKSKQDYGKPTYDSLFKYVLDKPSLQPSFFQAFAGLNIESATRIDEHMNPLKQLEELRSIINDKETINAVSSLESRDKISVYVKQKNGRKVHKEITIFLKDILRYFDDLRSAFPKPLYDGKMDFVCRLSNGDYAMVEMQVVSDAFWDNRALVYVAALYGKQMRKGDDWKNIKRVIGVNILGGGNKESEHWIDSPTEYIRHYKIQEQLHQPARYIDGIEIIQYSLMHAPPSIEDKVLNDWLIFFKEASRMTEDDVRKRISTPAVLEAFERAKLSTLPPDILKMYATEDERFAQYSNHTQELIKEATVKAEAKAEAKAIEERCNLIKKMKIEGFSDIYIRDLLSISSEEFQKYVLLIEDISR